MVVCAQSTGFQREFCQTRVHDMCLWAPEVSPEPKGVSPEPKGVSPEPEGVSPEQGPEVSPEPEGVSPEPEGVSPEQEGVSPERRVLCVCKTRLPCVFVCGRVLFVVFLFTEAGTHQKRLGIRWFGAAWPQSGSEIACLGGFSVIIAMFATRATSVSRFHTIMRAAAWFCRCLVSRGTASSRFGMMLVHFHGWRSQCKRFECVAG